MRRSTMFLLPFVSACMGGAHPVVLDDAATAPGIRDPIVGEVTELPLGHDGFALLLNDERIAGGVATVSEDGRLSRAAQLHAQDMVTHDYLSHTDLTGGAPGDRALAQGYDWNFIAENIARGFTREEAVIEAWMESDGHRDNMLDPRAEDFGVGLSGTTWVLMFGREFD